MSLPQIGDVLLRNLPDEGYELVDAVTRQHLQGPFANLNDAIVAARGIGGTIWRQVAAARGRPMGDPVRFLDRK